MARGVQKELIELTAAGTAPDFNRIPFSSLFLLKKFANQFCSYKGKAKYGTEKNKLEGFYMSPYSTRDLSPFFYESPIEQIEIC